MQGRLGVYDKQPYDKDKNTIAGVAEQQARFETQGGNSQQERMIKDKRRSLQRAVWYSYQGAEIVKVDATDKTPFRALINPSKLAQDYDIKTLSVGFEYNIQNGDIIEWVGTKTYWLVYLQKLTELAYFYGTIKKCSYQISWEDEEGKHSTYAALIGPQERNLATTKSHGIVMDTPNYSLSFLVPKNKSTLKYFKRYTKFYLQDDTTCWRIEATDWITTPGVIEVYANEYYANKDEDDIKNGVVGGLIAEIQSPNTLEEESMIRGETFIKVKQTAEYRFNGNTPGNWSVDKKYPVQLVVDSKDPRLVKLKWTSSYSGQFELYYGEYKKTIVVESLF